jgi:pimeloyl-ACP methyl ester carboxylesterase
MLADRFQVYVLDLRNHGESPHSMEMDYPAMAADVVRFMDSFALSSGVVLGHSMGGKVAMWLALNYADRVSELVVVDIAPVTYRHSFDMILQALQALPLEEVNNRKQALELLSSAIPEQSYRQFLLQNLQLVDGKYCWRIDLDIFTHTASAIPAFPSVELMPAFVRPALFIAGGNSLHIKPEYSGTIKALFPTSEITTLPDTGHWLHAENPSAFIKKVKDFLN